MSGREAKGSEACRHADELLVDYLYRELAPDQAAWFDAHLEACRDHAEQVAKLRAVLELVRSDTNALPAPDLSATLVAEARRRLEHEPPARRRGWFSWGWQPLAAAAAAGLVAVVVGVFAWRQWRPVTPVAERPVHLDGVVASRSTEQQLRGRAAPQAPAKLAAKPDTAAAPAGPAAAPAAVATREPAGLDEVSRPGGLPAGQDRDRPLETPAARVRRRPARPRRATVAAKAKQAKDRLADEGGVAQRQRQPAAVAGQPLDKEATAEVVADYSSATGRATGGAARPSAGLAAGRKKTAAAEEKLRFAQPPPPAAKAPLAVGDTAGGSPPAAPEPTPALEPPPRPVASAPAARPAQDYRALEESEVEADRKSRTRERRPATRRSRPARNRQEPEAVAATVAKSETATAGEDDAESLADRAERLLAERRPRDAARLIERRLDSLAGRQRADALYLLARAWHRLGYCRRQVEAAARALEAAPAHQLAAPTLLDRAACLVKLGRFDAARATYQRVMRHHPGHAGAARAGLRALDRIQGGR